MKPPKPEITEAINELAPVVPQPFNKSAAAEEALRRMRAMVGRYRPQSVPERQPGDDTEEDGL